jgi:hypothetical protein
MTDEQSELKINWSHWAGREDMKDYVNVSGSGLQFIVTRHVPSGLELMTSKRFRTDGGSNYSCYEFGPNLLNPAWQVTLVVYSILNGPSGAAWKIMKERGDDDISEAKRILRQRVGKTHTIVAVHPVTPLAEVPWTKDIVHILLNMVLIKQDPIAYREGLTPQPDIGRFAPPEVPKEFHAELKNYIPEVQA